MNNYNGVIGVWMLLLTAATPTAHALNITLSHPSGFHSSPITSGVDWQSVSWFRSEREMVHEMGVSRTAGGKLYQLEGMSVQVKDGVPWLFLVGRYDFQNRGGIDSVYGPNRYAGGKPGDLFIRIGNDFQTSRAMMGGVGPINNAEVGFEYAVAVSQSITSGNFAVYDLNEDTLIDAAHSHGVSWNPWRVKPLKKNLVVDDAFLTPAEYYARLTSAEVSEITGDHYANLDAGFALASAKDRRKSKHKPNDKFNVLGIDLSFLSGRTTSDDTIWFEFTNQRGEPVLLGSMRGGLPVSDGGVTVALLAFSLVAMGLSVHKAR